jgi:predicted ATP-grasp superfamily ATP-dependent carboligase
LNEQIDIIERTSVPSGALMLFGFPDVGLVGVIAAEHLVSELKLSEVAYLDSGLLPPPIVLRARMAVPEMVKNGFNSSFVVWGQF